ncbi:unnamed protein product [Vitrella brassicaformis CCMP3155]|uniref:Copper transport protein n=1 Tax=Vitrella brassicaformis (strain CCMP3155) TaxID=1169540 RepID=A0A0G4GSP8_VITBC|nr:unnamed protein product [Vitrella brassicaformis CCMP3155]|eukprot:CEM33718.1 unnamed protein product [Vitrella brassicaformis CCMP3155]
MTMSDSNSTMACDGMDGGGGMDMMMMQMWFYWGWNVTILFKWWSTTTPLQFALSALIVFAAAVLSMWLKKVRRDVEQHWSRSSLHLSSDESNMDPHSGGQLDASLPSASARTPGFWGKDGSYRELETIAIITPTRKGSQSFGSTERQVASQSSQTAVGAGTTREAFLSPAERGTALNGEGSKAYHAMDEGGRANGTSAEAYCSAIVVIPEEQQEQAVKAMLSRQHLKHNLIRSFLTTVTLGLDYGLMLVTMTFNAGLFLCVILGFGVGAFCFSPTWGVAVPVTIAAGKHDEQADGAPCCP